jgi:hypothetical protein
VVRAQGFHRQHDVDEKDEALHDSRDSYEQWAATARDSETSVRRAVRRSRGLGANALDVQLLKLVMLGTVITRLLEWAMPQAILNTFDRELENRRVMVDRGVRQARRPVCWRELLRNAIINESPLLRARDLRDGNDSRRARSPDTSPHARRPRIHTRPSWSHQRLRTARLEVADPCRDAPRSRQ